MTFDCEFKEWFLRRVDLEDEVKDGGREEAREGLGEGGKGEKESVKIK